MRGLIQVFGGTQGIAAFANKSEIAATLFRYLMLSTEKLRVRDKRIYLSARLIMRDTMNSRRMSKRKERP